MQRWVNSYNIAKHRSVAAWSSAAVQSSIMWSFAAVWSSTATEVWELSAVVGQAQMRNQGLCEMQELHQKCMKHHSSFIHSVAAYTPAWASPLMFIRGVESGVKR